MKKRALRWTGALLWLGFCFYTASWLAVWFLPGHDFGSQVTLAAVLLTWFVMWTSNVRDWLTDERRKEVDEVANEAARWVKQAYGVWLVSVAPEQSEQGEGGR